MKYFMTYIQFNYTNSIKIICNICEFYTIFKWYFVSNVGKIITYSFNIYFLLKNYLNIQIIITHNSLSYTYLNKSFEIYFPTIS
jgi:hypothetical protein